MAVVSGLSMVPTLAPGERLLVKYDGPIVLGDVVIFKRDESIEIKRVSRIDSQGLFVVGDNELVSTDSRSYGLIAFDAILGTASVRLWPKPGRIKG